MNRNLTCTRYFAQIGCVYNEYHLVNVIKPPVPQGRHGATNFANIHEKPSLIFHLRRIFWVFYPKYVCPHSLQLNKSTLKWNNQRETILKPLTATEWEVKLIDLGSRRQERRWVFPAPLRPIHIVVILKMYYNFGQLNLKWELKIDQTIRYPG